MLSKEQFLLIADMQDKMNILAAGADWKVQNLDWGLALMTEAMEASQHFGWKWWAKETPNIPQAAIETVDMLHFGMSGLLIQMPADIAYDMLEHALNDMHPDQIAEMDAWNFHHFIKEASCNAAIGNFGFAVYLTIRSAELVGLGSDKLFNAYVVKNVLNKFRKANGYKEGNYIKIWFGEEDNVYLEKYLSDYTNKGEVPTPEAIYEHLETFYADVTATQH
jgi:dimeric dUTPase (all-alpha-NTP-PPase superfamily)